MAQLTWQPMWISKEDFKNRNPLICNIHEVRIENRSGREEVVIEVVDGSSLHAQLSIWGRNKKTLIDKFGNDTDNWKGKGISIVFDPATNHKVIQ